MSRESSCREAGRALVGADVEHPEARFYLEDDSGRALVDPRRAVLFSEDGVLVAGERVHIVGLVVFAVSVLGLVDREMSEPIARLIETLSSSSSSPSPSP